MASGGTSTERAGVLRYSASTGMEKMMEDSPAAITGSMLLRSWSRMNALSVYSSLDTDIRPTDDGEETLLDEG